MPVVVAALVVLGPCLLAPHRWFAGAMHLDAYGTQWYYWLVERQLLGGEDVGRSALLFHPWGKDVFLHTGGNLLDAWLALPLRLMLGPVAGYDAWLVLLLLGNGFAGFRLARVLGADSAGGLLAALLMVVNPYVLMELQLGRPTQAFLLFPVLCLAELLRMDRPGRAARVGVWMALAGWTYWYSGLACGALAMVHGLLRAGTGPHRLRVLGLHGLAAGVALVLVAPGAWPLLTALDQGAVPGLLALGQGGPLWGLALRTVEGDAEGLFVLAPLAGTGGSLIDVGGIRFNPGYRLFTLGHLGFVAAGLVALRRHRPLVVVWGLLALLVAAGPALVVGEHFLPNPVYLGLLHLSDVARRWWWPGRVVFVLHALVAALAGVALARWRHRRVAVPAVALLGILVLVPAAREGLLPLDRWPAEQSPALSCLAQAPEGAVLDLPFARDQKHLYLQTLHGKPILGGMLSQKEAFAPPEQVALLKENGFVDLLVDLGNREFTRSLAWSPADRQALLGVGYRYVLVRPDAYLRPRPRRDGSVEEVSDWPRLRRTLERPLGEPHYEDAHLALYAIEGRISCGGGLTP